MSEGSGEPGTGNTEMKIAGDPRFIVNMTVWSDAVSLKTFVFDSQVHGTQSLMVRDIGRTTFSNVVGA
jgi:hypothetical protein